MLSFSCTPDLCTVYVLHVIADKLKSVQRWPTPRDYNDVQRALGMMKSALFGLIYGNMSRIIHFIRPTASDGGSFADKALENLTIAHGSITPSRSFQPYCRRALKRAI